MCQLAPQARPSIQFLFVSSHVCTQASFAQFLAVLHLPSASGYPCFIWNKFGTPARDLYPIRSCPCRAHTPSSSGHATAGFAHCVMSLMSNVVGVVDGLEVIDADQQYGKIPARAGFGLHSILSSQRTLGPSVFLCAWADTSSMARNATGLLRSQERQQFLDLHGVSISGPTTYRAPDNSSRNKLTACARFPA